METECVLSLGDQRWTLPPESDGADTITIGRASNADIRLQADDQISRIHARLTRTAGAWTLHDESRNGTGLNGLRITAPTPLTSGDRIHIGRSILTFHKSTTPGPTAPTPVTPAGNSTPPPPAAAPASSTPDAGSASFTPDAGSGSFTPGAGSGSFTPGAGSGSFTPDAGSDSFTPEAAPASFAPEAAPAPLAPDAASSLAPGTPPPLDPAHSAEPTPFAPAPEPPQAAEQAGPLHPTGHATPADFPPPPAERHPDDFRPAPAVPHPADFPPGPAEPHHDDFPPPPAERHPDDFRAAPAEPQPDDFPPGHIEPYSDDFPPAPAEPHPADFPSATAEPYLDGSSPAPVEPQRGDFSPAPVEDRAGAFPSGPLDGPYADDFPPAPEESYPAARGDGGWAAYPSADSPEPVRSPWEISARIDQSQPNWNEPDGRPANTDRRNGGGRGASAGAGGGRAASGGTGGGPGASGGAGGGRNASGGAGGRRGASGGAGARRGASGGAGAVGDTGASRGAGAPGGAGGAGRRGLRLSEQAAEWRTAEGGDDAVGTVRLPRVLIAAGGVIVLGLIVNLVVTFFSDGPGGALRWLVPPGIALVVAMVLALLDAAAPKDHRPGKFDVSVIIAIAVVLVGVGVGGFALTAGTEYVAGYLTGNESGADRLTKPVSKPGTGITMTVEKVTYTSHFTRIEVLVANGSKEAFQIPIDGTTFTAADGTALRADTGKSSWPGKIPAGGNEHGTITFKGHLPDSADQAVLTFKSGTTTFAVSGILLTH
ncbi:FHA domain-containing protein [Kribbella sp. NPDC004536]|uniref:FHA domain-containing protein n=1 Tax=Kribbella sp. NPDC004536 TaxID=3364106 RepID=UPI003674EFE6